MKQTLIYGTWNVGKLTFMREIVHPLGITLLGLDEINIAHPTVDERGNDPLENARAKALAYYHAIRKQTPLTHPVFSCDSGLYFENMPSSIQPGVHVRRVRGKSLTDEEMVAYYAGLAAKMGGQLLARYTNAICLVVSANEIYEYMGEDIASDRFLLAGTPHPKREVGFPINSLSIHIESGAYYNDLPIKPRTLGENGYRRFFAKALEPQDGGLLGRFVVQGGG
jgi:8-oxo-dGTP diphosphatase